MPKQPSKPSKSKVQKPNPYSGVGHDHTRDGGGSKKKGKKK